jgi:precorrin-6Y C5,15-methyltransferase (decarboxylating)
VQVKIFEKNPKAVELIRRNAAKNGASFVTVLEGEASELLRGMEKPDCVFIGGSGGKLKEMLEILHRKGRGIRFVITAVSLETLGEVTDLLQTYDTADESIIQLAVTNVERIGRHRMMRANNPVFIISFTL